MHDAITAGVRSSLQCPFCGVYDEHDAARCLFGEGFLSEGLFEALHRVTSELPDLLPSVSWVGGLAGTATARRLDAS